MIREDSTEVQVPGSKDPYRVHVLMLKTQAYAIRTNITVTLAHGDARVVYADTGSMPELERIRRDFFSDPLCATRRVLDGSYHDPGASVTVFDKTQSKRCMLALLSDKLGCFDSAAGPAEEVIEGAKGKILFGLTNGIPFGTALLL